VTESKNALQLSVVMPAYNEEKIIYDNLLTAASEIEAFCSNFEIIAVNDGSSDSTREEVLRARSKDKRIKLISYKKNRGKGYAVRRGMTAASGEYVAFLDSDLDLPAYQLEGFLTKLRETGADIAIGSKLHKSSNIEYSPMRRLMSYVYYRMVKLLFRLDVKDTQTGLKVFRAETCRSIFEGASINRFSFDIEMLAMAAKKGLSIIELPVVMQPKRSTMRRSKISIKQIFIMIYDTINIWMRIH